MRPVMPWEFRWPFRLLGVCGVLLAISGVLAAITASLSDSGKEASESGGYEAATVLLSLALAMGRAGFVVTLLAAAVLVVVIGMGVWARVARSRGRGGAPDLSSALDTLIAGLADAEGQHLATKAELEQMRAEQERLRALASLTPEQLKAITQTVAPGARKGLWIAVATGLLGLVTWLVSLWLDKQLPGLG